MQKPYGRYCNFKGQNENLTWALINNVGSVSVPSVMSKRVDFHFSNNELQALSIYITNVVEFTDSQQIIVREHWSAF